jgi:hypothetical protein
MESALEKRKKPSPCISPRPSATLSVMHSLANRAGSAGYGEKKKASSMSL